MIFGIKGTSIILTHIIYCWQNISMLYYLFCGPGSHIMTNSNDSLCVYIAKWRKFTSWTVFYPRRPLNILNAKTTPKRLNDTCVECVRAFRCVYKCDIEKDRTRWDALIERQQSWEMEKKRISIPQKQRDERRRMQTEICPPWQQLGRDLLSGDPGLDTEASLH